MKRYRITGWGHPTLPDLDDETDDIHDPRLAQYPFSFTHMRVAVSREDILAALNGPQIVIDDA